MSNIPLISNNFNYSVKISTILNVIKIYVFTVRKKSDQEMRKSEQSVEFKQTIMHITLGKN